MPTDILLFFIAISLLLLTSCSGVTVVADCNQRATMEVHQTSGNCVTITITGNPMSTANPNFSIPASIIP